MLTTRSQTPDKHVSRLFETLTDLRQPCVGCRNCRGLCSALIDAIVLPELILSKDPAA